jgi:two-component system, NtrC family, sensor kinase
MAHHPLMRDERVGREGKPRADGYARDCLRYLLEDTDLVTIVFDSIEAFGVVVADFDGSIIAFSAGAEKIYGLRTEEVVGRRSVGSLFCDGFVAEGRFERMVSDLLVNGRLARDVEKIRGDGSHFPARIVWSLLRDKGGKMIGFVELTEDLTERRRADEATEQARQCAVRIEQL